MKKYFVLGIALVTILIASLLGYGVYLNERGENQITDRMENLKIPLTGAVAQVREISPVMKLDLVNLYPVEMTDVVALEGGRITQVLVDKNSYVKVGDPLFILVDEDIPLKIRQADSDILQAEAALIQAENSFHRYEKLREVEAVSMEKFDEAAANFKAAQARLENFRAQREQLAVRQSRLTITSPIEGEVLMVYQQAGSYVKAGSVVALVGDFSTMYFTVPVEGRMANFMVPGRAADLSFADSNAAQKSYGAEYAAGNRGKDEIFEARLMKVSPPLEEEASIRQVVWEVDNRAGILEPGVYTGARLRPRSQRRCLCVPLEALTDYSRDEVAVVTTEGTLEYRPVKMGSSDGKYIEIISGLSEGETVITSAVDGIKDGTPVEVTLEEGD